MSKRARESTEQLCKESEHTRERATITAGISIARARRQTKFKVQRNWRSAGNWDGEGEEGVLAPTSLLALLALLLLPLMSLSLSMPSLLLLLPSQVSFSTHSVSRSRRSIVASSSLAFVNRISAPGRKYSQSISTGLQSYIGIHSRHDLDNPRNVRDVDRCLCHRLHVAVCPALQK